MTQALGGSGPPPQKGVTCAWGVQTPPLKRWHLCLGGQVTSCSATALVLHFAYTLLTLRCWSYTSLLVPRGPDRTTIGPASRTWYLAGPCPFTHGASPAVRVACWLCSARTDGADTHDPSRHAIELMHKPIPLCLRGARLTARDPLRLVVFAHHRLHTRRLVHKAQGARSRVGECCHWHSAAAQERRGEKRRSGPETTRERLCT